MATETELEAQASAPTPLRIRVVRERGGTVTVTGFSGTLPTVLQLREFLPPDLRRTLRARLSGYLSSTALVTGNHVTPQEYADLLVTYHYRQNQNEGVSEVPNGPMYLTAGSTLYRLSPVRQVETSRAMAGIRARARADADLERETIIADARVTASSLTAEAQRLVQQAEQREIRSRQMTDRIPIPVGLYNQNLNVSLGDGIQIKTQGSVVIRTFRHGRLGWRVPEGLIRLHPFWFWIVISSDFSTVLWTQFHIDHDEPGTLPHMGMDSACVTPGNQISLSFDDFTSYDSARRKLQEIRASLCRAFETVNIASLLEPMGNWYEGVRETVPEALLERLENSENDLPEAEFREEEMPWITADRVR